MFKEWSTCEDRYANTNWRSWLEFIKSSQNVLCFSKFIHRQIKADERQVNTIVLWGGERGKPKKKEILNWETITFKTTLNKTGSTFAFE